jgi:pyruvate dehydrogenase E1 component
MVSYDPSFAYELAVLVRDGIDRMYGRQEDVFYYVTIHNQNYAMPAMPAGAADGIIKGMYCFQRSPAAAATGRRAHLFGSGAIMTEVLEAARLLQDAGIAADVWSVTSYNQLSREALRVERDNRLTGRKNKPYVKTLLEDEAGVFVAASDYMKALALSIADWVPGPYTVLGTDGYGLSESREDLRRHFEVSAEYIAHAAAAALAASRAITRRELRDLAARWHIDARKPDAASAGPTAYR